MALDRNDYAKLSADEIKRRIRQTEARSARASTMQAALQDMFALQELQAALELQRVAA